jgi:hypothetical protein
MRRAPSCWPQGWTSCPKIPAWVSPSRFDARISKTKSPLHSPKNVFLAKPRTVRTEDSSNIRVSLHKDFPPVLKRTTRNFSGVTGIGAKILRLAEFNDLKT